MTRNWHLDEDRAWALGMEMRTGILHIEEGLRAFTRLNINNDFFPPSAVLLSSGLEHFLKLLIALMVELRTGRFLTEKALRQMGGRDGHALIELVDALVAEVRYHRFAAKNQARTSLEEIAAHPVVRQGMITLTELAEADNRYFFLNAVLTGQQPERSPVEMMTALDGAVERSTRDPDSGKHYGELTDLVVTGDVRGALRLRNRRVLEAFEMFVHVLAHLYVFASPVSDPILQPWLDLEWYGIPPRVRWGKAARTREVTTGTTKLTP